MYWDTDYIVMFQPSDKLLRNTYQITLPIPDINECESEPCQNNGICTQGVNDYTCDCASGYAAVNCEIGKYYSAGGCNRNEDSCYDNYA